MRRSRSGAARFAPAIMSLIAILGGVSLAVIPAATLAIAARVFSTVEQGSVAVAITAATFIGQVVFAVVVESRLSSALTDRRVTFPLWLASAGLAAALAVCVFPTNATVLCLALPVMVAALEVGRGVSVAERLDRREIAAAALVGLGALGGVLAALANQTWGFTSLAGGIALATIVRCLPVAHRASKPHLPTMGWVVADVSITGVIYPLINTMILALLGPLAAVLFTAISTVSGLLAIPLNFMRLRLLKDHSPLDIAVSAGSLVVATAAIAVAEFTGVLGLVFGDAWTVGVTVIPLAVACLWRAASLAATIPFASLRRNGHVQVVTLLRATAAILTFGLAFGGVATGDILGVFIALLLGEFVQAALYETARRRLAARPSPGASSEAGA
ncbi:hypothetical protein B0I08_103117 [Glaciihabitans tibetensis]|uniref:O-antigen/teichoic acid export membrane protein n=1 Tax=Glaciihabitans tibetensis TaxID=1266600 RepID=A0A2T0VFH3_9MICO|nr:hypothetical protein [Glaciihabitans tibetensis]PRY68912.1 hypothetical protein B0I08_103117 [Glaciihabitans tibetensis]